MTETEAIDAAMREIQNFYPHAVILYTVEGEKGWLVNYIPSEAYRFIERLGGPVPMIVDKQDLSVHPTSHLYSDEIKLRLFDAYRDAIVSGQTELWQVIRSAARKEINIDEI